MGVCELPDESRLAHAWFANDRDDLPMAAAGAL
jgi:hypothetical protein